MDVFINTVFLGIAYSSHPWRTNASSSYFYGSFKFFCFMECKNCRFFM